MLQRIIALAIVAAALLSLIIYSQTRPVRAYVSGVIEVDEIRLGSRVGGRVRDLHVSEGDSVETSMALVEFEPFELNEREQQAIALLAESEASLKKFMAGMRNDEIAQAKARFNRAAAELSLVQAGPRPEEIAAAQNRLSAANAEFLLAQRDNKRTVELYEARSIPKSEFDQSSERLESARAQVDLRNNELKILQSGSREQEILAAKAAVDETQAAWQMAQSGYRVEDKEQAAAARDAAKAALDAIRQQKKELVLRAPSHGVIDALDLQPGDLVAPNAPVLTMLSRDRMWVRAYVPQRFMQLAVGQSVRVTLDSFSNRDFTGRITFVSGQAEFTPSNVQTPDDRARQVYRIRVQLDGDLEMLRPGMTANVWLESLKGQ